jgi:hypothetical protein
MSSMVPYLVLIVFVLLMLAHRVGAKSLWIQVR